MEKLLWKDRKEIRREVLCAEFWWRDIEFRQGAGEGLVTDTTNSTIKGHSGGLVGGFWGRGSQPELGKDWKSPGHGVRAAWGQRPTWHRS